MDLLLDLKYLSIFEIHDLCRIINSGQGQKLRSLNGMKRIPPKTHQKSVREIALLDPGSADARLHNLYG
jgi:hypothetical protein